MVLGANLNARELSKIHQVATRDLRPKGYIVLY